MKKNIIITFLVLAFASSFCKAQQHPPDTIIYLNLSSVKFTKHQNKNRTVKIKTKRLANDCLFSISCKNCQPGSDILSFFWNDNLETGFTFEPVTIIPDTGYQKLKFMPFTEMVDFLRKYENKRFPKLYFVETVQNKHYQYHVRLLGFFGTE
jgi:hypothetical protein